MTYSFNVSSQNDISEHRRHSWCFFCCIFFCSLQSKTYSCAKAEPRSKQEMVGEEARRERQWEPLAPSPIIFLRHPRFSFHVAESLTLWTTPKKKQPAMQATLKISVMSWTCQGMNIGMYHLNFELFLLLHPKSPPPPHSAPYGWADSYHFTISYPNPLKKPFLPP